jgi:hypothetical protein
MTKKTVAQAVAISLLAFAIYAILPDIRRYIKISTM